MTAGMVKVPTIVPLRPPSNNRKNMIDTKTPIEILSDTDGALIYYTVNGRQPNPFQKIGEKFTYRYYNPFVLGPGKKTVKALATTSDGTRESSIVTKTFLVEEIVLDEKNEDEMFEEHGRENNESLGNTFANSMGELSLSKSTKQNGWTTHSGQRKSISQRSSRREDVKSPEYLRLFLDRSSYGNQYDERRPDTTAQMDETHFNNKCIYCFAPWPSDPYSTYCNDCGSLLPQVSQVSSPTRTTQEHAEKLVLCKMCHSMVPLSEPTCMVCEAAMSPQRLPNTSPPPRSPEKLICEVCDTVNTTALSMCIACESSLSHPSKKSPLNVSAPPLPKECEPLITCSKCFRVNSGEARFCDWCGSKPIPYASYLTCSRCNGSNQPYSKYCSLCACHIEAPPRTSSTDSVLATLVEKRKVPKSRSASNLTTWIPVNVPRLSGETANQATQTGGLFYPSSTSLSKYQRLEANERARNDHLRDRKPLFGAVSPGRGYWRQQIDHVCSHLRAHAQNDQTFRATIGEPRIGKLITTTVDDDSDEEEFKLTVTFTRRHTDNAQNKTKPVHKVSSSTRKEKKLDLVDGSAGNIDSSSNEGKKKTPKRSRKKKAILERTIQSTLSNETRQLFKELGKFEEGNPEEIERLISEGADVNAENADGMRVLSMAVLHNHVDCIALLVNEGADVSHQSASKGNTALHEAVLQQNPSARQCIDVLLRCGADTRLKNKADESAYDLAVKSKNESIIEKFTTNLGQELLQKLTKTKS